MFGILLKFGKNILLLDFIIVFLKILVFLAYRHHYNTIKLNNNGLQSFLMRKVSLCMGYHMFLTLLFMFIITSRIFLYNNNHYLLLFHALLSL